MKNYIICFLFAGLIIAGCEIEITPESIEAEPEYVVESHIEAGPGASVPPYLILTESVPYFTTVNGENINDQFVNGAEVIMEKDGKSVQLTEYCLSELSPEIKQALSEEFNIDDSIGIDFCIYADLANELAPSIGDRVNLEVTTGEDLLQASTECVDFIPIDSFSFEPTPGEPLENYKRLLIFFTDQQGVENYYRYQIAVNDGPFRTAPQSVADDGFVDGKTFSFPLLNPEPDSADITSDTYGYFKVGDTVRLKWSTIDKPHYDFWLTLENNSNSTGPFTTYSRIASNVDEAFGIFGAYTTETYILTVE